MQGDKKTIQHLNKVLIKELTTINQYFLHARMLKNWGLNEIAEVEYHASIKEMKLADRLIERILFLEGLPNLQALDKLYIGENAGEILSGDLKLCHETAVRMREAIVVCELAGDFVSRDLLQNNLDFEEERIDWLETQLQLIELVELPNYLQSQIDSNQ